MFHDNSWGYICMFFISVTNKQILFCSFSVSYKVSYFQFCGVCTFARILSHFFFFFFKKRWFCYIIKRQIQNITNSQALLYGTPRKGFDETSRYWQELFTCSWLIRGVAGQDREEPSCQGLQLKLNLPEAFFCPNWSFKGRTGRAR